MTKPVVLIAEELSPATIDALGPDFEIRHLDGADRAQLLPGLVDVDAVLIRSATQMDAEAIAAAKKLKVIARAGVGLDNVDVPAATQAGVMVVNAPTSNITSAAELAIGLLLATARNIAPANASLKGGAWKRSQYGGVELLDKTVGIVGLGRIGALVAERLKGFGMSVARLRPVRVAGQGRPARCPARRARRAARRVRLHHRAPAQDARDRRPHRRGGAHQGQADRADRQRGARRHRRRAGAGRRDRATVGSRAPASTSSPRSRPPSRRSSSSSRSS